MKDTRYYICMLVGRPDRPEIRIPPIASQTALNARQANGENIDSWIGVPDGVKQSRIQLDDNTCIIQMTSEESILDNIEKNKIIKRIDSKKDVSKQGEATADLIKFGAKSTDNADVAIRKICKSAGLASGLDLEFFFDKQLQKLKR